MRRTIAAIEAELHALGWKIIEGPTATHAGWKVTAAKGEASVSTSDLSAIDAMEMLLRHVKQYMERP